MLKGGLVAPRAIGGTKPRAREGWPGLEYHPEKNGLKQEKMTLSPEGTLRGEKEKGEVAGTIKNGLYVCSPRFREKGKGNNRFRVGPHQHKKEGETWPRSTPRNRGGKKRKNLLKWGRFTVERVRRKYARDLSRAPAREEGGGDFVKFLGSRDRPRKKCRSESRGK